MSDVYRRVVQETDCPVCWVLAGHGCRKMWSKPGYKPLLPRPHLERVQEWQQQIFAKHQREAVR